LIANRAEGSHRSTWKPAINNAEETGDEELDGADVPVEGLAPTGKESLASSLDPGATGTRVSSLSLVPERKTPPLTSLSPDSHAVMD